MHLHLDFCGLNYEIINDILPFIKHSPSLVAVHLGNNPGITEKTKPLLISRLVGNEELLPKVA